MARSNRTRSNRTRRNRTRRNRTRHNRTRRNHVRVNRKNTLRRKYKKRKSTKRKSTINVNKRWGGADTPKPEELAQLARSVGMSPEELVSAASSSGMSPAVLVGQSRAMALASGQPAGQEASAAAVPTPGTLEDVGDRPKKRVKYYDIYYDTGSAKGWVFRTPEEVRLQDGMIYFRPNSKVDKYVVGRNYTENFH